MRLQAWIEQTRTHTRSPLLAHYIHTSPLPLPPLPLPCFPTRYTAFASRQVYFSPALQLEMNAEGGGGGEDGEDTPTQSPSRLNRTSSNKYLEVVEENELKVCRAPPTDSHYIHVISESDTDVCSF